VDLSTSSYVEDQELSVSLDLLNAIASAKVKLSDKISYQGNFRRGYWDLLVDLEALGASLLFYDTWNKFIYQPNDKNLIEMTLLYGKDRFGYRNEERNIEVLHYDSDFDKIYGWVNWKTHIHDRLFSRLTVGYQGLRKDSDFEFESSISEDNPDNANFRMLSLNEYLVQDLGKSSTLSYGLEYRYFTNHSLFNEVRYDVFQSTAPSLVIDTLAVDTKIKGHLYGFYADYAFQNQTGWSGNVGVRASGQSYVSNLHIAPRVNLSYRWNEMLSAGAGYGWFFQPDFFYDLRSELGQRNLQDEAAKAIHYTTNVTVNLPKTTIRLDLFFKDYVSLFDDYRLLPTDRIESFKSFETDFNPVKGNSRGAELSINYFYRDHTLNFSYVYGRNKMTNAAGEETFRDLDVTHSLFLNNLWKLKNNFTISASVFVRSGFPYSEVENVEGISTKNELNQVIFYEIGGKNRNRYSAYQTLDFKVAKNWYGKNVKWEASLNILNTFNATNVRNFFYDGFLNRDNEVGVSLEENLFFPFFISPGIKLAFY